MSWLRSIQVFQYKAVTLDHSRFQFSPTHPSHSCPSSHALGTPTARPSIPSAPAAQTRSSLPRTFPKGSTRSISTRQVLFSVVHHSGLGAQRLFFGSPGGGSAASQIVENIQDRTWTASDVLEAYIARAAQAQQATNCLTEGTWCTPS
jgi:hypothetical protein